MCTLSMKWIFVAVMVILMNIGCSDSSTNRASVSGRWYTPNQVTSGEELFQQHCAVCHKPKAQGTTEWKRRLPNGALPPPPLNGSAHAWHHDMKVLMRTIEMGGTPLGGTMPPFGDKLSDSDKRAVIAYFQSFWSDETYQIWEQRD